MHHAATCVAVPRAPVRRVQSTKFVPKTRTFSEDKKPQQTEFVVLMRALQQRRSKREEDPIPIGTCLASNSFFFSFSKNERPRWPRQCEHGFPAAISSSTREQKKTSCHCFCANGDFVAQFFSFFQILFHFTSGHSDTLSRTCMHA
jgi:hypothetical protein